jgi:hypothetical protein
MASDNNNSLTLQLPSELKAGTYILKTELWALHANNPVISAISFGLPRPQIYNHCFNVEIISDGTATPAGVKFPGGYSVNDPGVGFTPCMRSGDGIGENKKYVSTLDFNIGGPQ